MNILFMSLGVFNNLEEGSVHVDLVKELAKEHEVWLVCKHEGQKTELTMEHGIHVLRVHTGTLKRVGLIQKGINTILVEPQFRRGIGKYLKGVPFDLVLYTTPPITFASAVKYVKQRDNAVTYLLLKDIFPQNAVDLGMMTKTGVKSGIYKYFRKKEQELYSLSDYIGCMSPGNMEYVLKHNPALNAKKVGECPNATIITDLSVDDDTRNAIRCKYNIPLYKKVFVYGGNLGKPQGISFLIECLRDCKQVEEVLFLIIGQGTEYPKIENYIKKEKPQNVRLMNHLPKQDYEKLVAACDVGMIFLDHRFTIPNFPSRLLSYMKAKIPVLAVTDPNTDLSKIITDGHFGWWCESNNIKAFVETVNEAKASDIEQIGNNGFDYLTKHYNIEDAVKVIVNKYKELRCESEKDIQNEWGKDRY